MSTEAAREIRTPTEAVKRMKTVTADGAPSGTLNQPVSSIHWIDKSLIRPNPWNSNFVPKPELRLLKLSILLIGWVFPLVVSQVADGVEEYEINDGHHRWLVAHDPDVSALTGGLVPATILFGLSEAERMMVTLRMNRARGNEHVLGTADVVASIIATGITQEQLEVMLQMEDEEIRRFLDKGNMLKRGTGDTEDFANGWVPR